MSWTWFDCVFTQLTKVRPIGFLLLLFAIGCTYQKTYDHFTRQGKGDRLGINQVDLHNHRSQSIFDYNIQSWQFFSRIMIKNHTCSIPGYVQLLPIPSCFLAFRTTKGNIYSKFL